MTTAETIREPIALDTDKRPQWSIREAIKAGISRDCLYDALRDGRVRSTYVGRKLLSVDRGDVSALLGHPQPPEPLPSFRPTPLRDQDRSDYQSPGDKARAAALLVGVVSGDRLGVTAGIIAAQRADRVSATINTVVAVAVEALPELRNTDVVDRLRAIVAAPGVQKLNR